MVLPPQEETDHRRIIAHYEPNKEQPVEFGGNGNTTTRFRKYYGNGQKPLSQEYLDSAYLLKPNHTYHISITVRDGKTTFCADGKIYFEWTDPDPLSSGYFGFRSISPGTCD